MAALGEHVGYQAVGGLTEEPSVSGSQKSELGVSRRNIVGGSVGRSLIRGIAYSDAGAGSQVLYRGVF